jgi:hypothetical protein
LEIPLIAFTGDTAPGPHLIREDVRKAQIVIAECTFFEPDHKERAKVGMHMHLDDIAEWLRILECQHLVLVHVSRRTDMQYARERIAQVAGAKNMERVLFLMDYRTNKARYEGQMVAAGMSLEKPMGRSGPRPTRGPAPARGPGATGASPITPVTPIVQVPPASQPADRDDE